MTEDRGQRTEGRKQDSEGGSLKTDGRMTFVAMRDCDAAVNIREGFAKRRFENVFIRHLNDSIGSSEETRGWLDFSLRCRYID